MTGVLNIVRRFGFIVGLPLILLAAWWFGTAGSTKYATPPLEDILRAFPDVFTLQAVHDDVVPSLYRYALGLGGSIVLGILLGVLIGSSSVLRSLLDPLLGFLRAVPPPVLVPFFILLAGIETTSKVLLIISGAIWPVLLNTVEGVRGVDPVQVDTCRSYRVGGALRLRAFVLRAASPQIMAGVRQAAAIALILMVISEMKAAHDGIGYRIVQAQRGFQIRDMWIWVLVLGALGVVLALLVWLAERRILYWYRGLRAAARQSR